ncbi:MAG: cysteine desulfurase family protein [Armatimonadota bacterium]
MSIFDPPVYLDYAASTPLHHRVLEEMLPFLSSGYGNPSSTHQFGRRARGAIDDARDSVAQLLHADASEICFTSGGTEADNLAVFGSVLSADPSRRRVVVSAIEHHAVLHAANRLSDMGFEVQYAPVTRSGNVDLNAISALIDEQTVLVSVMLANNETGVVLPVKKIARIAKAAGSLMHTDAVQAAGLINIDPKDLGVDMLSISAHKFYGPKGVGALSVRRGVKLTPLLYGGAQERERRAGTEDVAAIVGMGAASRLALAERNQWRDTVNQARQAFQDEFDTLAGISLHGETEKRLPNILNYGLSGVSAELLTMRLDALGIAISTGAACASGSLEPSHVLTAMGFDKDEVNSSIRISFGRDSGTDVAGQAAKLIAKTILHLRHLRQMPQLHQIL